MFAKVGWIIIRCNSGVDHERPTFATSVSDLDAYWMPFTANRQFKGKPRMLARASGMYYETPEGRRILDGVAGLWCVNAGHGRPEITQAVAQQLETMDYAPPFQIGHPAAFELANALVKHRARGTRSRVLHELGLRVGRYRAQDRARVSPGERRCGAHAV